MKALLFKRDEWLPAIPQLLAFVLAGSIIHVLNPLNNWAFNFLMGWLLVYAYRFLIRYTVTRHHADGMQRVQAKQYAEAIPEFVKTFEFFERHGNLDKWRSVLLLSPSRYSFREMSLLNLGFVYDMLGNSELSCQYYRSALEINTNNEIARSALAQVTSHAATQN